MKNARHLLLVIILITTYTSNAQVAVNTDGSSPDGTAILDIKSNDKGLLIPRMTRTQIEAISSPANGLIVYNTDEDKLFIYTDATSAWMEVALGTGLIRPGGVFVCGDDFTDSRNAQSYASVQIGTQCWMAENLNIGTRVDGSGDQSNNSIIEKYCYADDDSNCDTYGGLYQWDEMMQYVSTEGTQGICPTDWHLPTDAEWCTLEQELDPTITCGSTGGRGSAGNDLKEAGTTHWSSSTGATNSSGFTALPGGFRSTNTLFYNILVYGGFRSSTESGTNAVNRIFRDNSVQSFRGIESKIYGQSVRCIRD